MSEIFDLEKAIKEWRSKLKKHPGLEPGFIEELEEHLRDKIDRLIAEGLNEKEAFDNASTNQFDNINELAEQFHVARTKSPVQPTWQSQSSFTNLLPSYFKIAWRNLTRQKGFALINISGLAIGISVSVLILLFVYEELTYNRFHTNSERIYRIISEREGSEIVEVSPLLAPTLESSIPEIEGAVRFLNRNGLLVSRTKKNDEDSVLSFYEDGLLYADSTFFDLFSFSLIQGNPKKVLEKPYAVVISESIANKYFRSENPVGNSIYIAGNSFEITGIVKDPPFNSTIQFNFLASFSSLYKIPDESGMVNSGWFVGAYPSYVMVRENAEIDTVEEKIKTTLENKLGGSKAGDWYLQHTFRLEPITESHFSNISGGITAPSDIRYVYTFLIIALLVLLIACINYMNLATARSIKRSKEVGLRKVVGAKRSQLAGQFLGESILMGFLSLLIAVVILHYAIPVFDNILEREMADRYLRSTFFWMSLIGITVVVGLISGSYPAIVLSRFMPTSIFQSQSTPGMSGTLLRKVLVIFQFTISIALIADTILIQNQLEFVHEKKLGFDKEHVLVVPMRGSTLRKQADVFSSELEKLSQIKQVTLSSTIPTRSTPRFGIKNEGDEQTLYFSLYAVDSQFLETFDIALVGGRSYTEEINDNSQHERLGGALINESAVNALGWDNPIGKEIPVEPNGNKYKVIGIIEDFHLSSLHREIAPLIIAPVEDFWKTYASVKLEKGSPAQTIASIQQIWENMAPGLPFDYFFLDDAYDQLYKAEDRLATIFNSFTFLAIFIASIGLLGLAAFATDQRTKEIGIRKILGASFGDIIALLSKDFMKLILVSMILAAPLAHYFVQTWLKDFAYRIDPGPGLFIAAGIIAVIIAMITISYQAVKAALKNPVQSLRNE